MPRPFYTWMDSAATGLNRIKYDQSTILDSATICRKREQISRVDSTPPQPRIMTPEAKDDRRGGSPNARRHQDVARLCICTVGIPGLSCNHPLSISTSSHWWSVTTPGFVVPGLRRALATPSFPTRHGSTSYGSGNRHAPVGCCQAPLVRWG